MSSLFVDRRNVHLELDAGALVFRENGQRVGTVPLAPIRRVFLRGSVTLQASLLGKLGERGVGVVVLSGRLARPSLLLSLPHHDASRRVQQTRMSLDEGFCLQVARQLLDGKLERQHDWLDQLRSTYPRARYALTRAMRQLQAQRPQLKQARQLENLRGMEGAAAQAYFAGLREVVPASFAFHERNRRPPRDPFNVLLSLTYTMAHAEVAMALHGAGLDPCIGFYHQPSWGRESLASDVLEPIRPLADRLCLHLCASQTLTPAHFSQADGACLLGKAGRVRYYEAYEEQAATTLRSAIAQQVAWLQEVLQTDRPATAAEGAVLPAAPQIQRQEP